MRKVYCLANLGTFARLAFAASVILASGMLSTASRAEQVDYDQVMYRADQQRMLLEQMTKESLLVALQIDSERHLERLKSAHALFNHVRVGLREGDGALGLPPAQSSVVLDKLSLVDSLWPLFDNTVRRSIETGNVGRTEIDALAEMSGPLQEALEDAVEAYGTEVTKERLHSIRFALINVTSQQSTLTQKMAKEFCLIAYGHEVRKNKSRLKKSAARFSRSLQALQRGDQKQKLIAAPTKDIKRQLDEVELLWIRFQDLIDVAGKGQELSQGEVQKVADLGTEILDALDKALVLYREL